MRPQSLPELHNEAPYPKLGATVEKFRRKAWGGLKVMSREEVVAYAAAIDRSIRSLQRSALMRETPDVRPNCASGTVYPDGKRIHAALQSRQRARLAAAPGLERRRRSPKAWRDMYDDAMAEKRAAAMPERNAA